MPQRFPALDSTLDGLLRTQAHAVPDRVAIRTADSDLTFAELDNAATGFAAWLAKTLGSAGHLVAVANPLVPAFASAYYGVVRSGNTVVILNPLLSADGLVHILETAEVRVAVVPQDLVARLDSIRHLLPKLRTIVPLAALPAEAGPPTADPASTACIHFTSGTTGPPKGVMLSHRNVTTNARQVAEAHRLDGTSVTVNHLPTYHPMHLNAAVSAGAMQVLCADPDSAKAIAAANANAATHYYSLPVRLSRLSVDPRLSELRLTPPIAILSGGSALPRRVVTTLNTTFGVPVGQGYGLAEMSPLTHSDDPFAPTIGSVGRPVAETECRVHDLDNGNPVPAGMRGEVRVRGPQLMTGYLRHDSAPNIDEDGWLATGDVGYVDEAGRLFLVDRIKDVFKCDNWLVAPSEIEAVLGRHSDVVDCVVVDLPDEFHGHVAGAVVVLRDLSTTTTADIAAWVNEQVPVYQHLHTVTRSTIIPRSPNGKVSRRDLRDMVRDRRNEE